MTTTYYIHFSAKNENDIGNLDVEWENFTWTADSKRETKKMIKMIDFIMRNENKKYIIHRIEKKETMSLEEFMK